VFLYMTLLIVWAAMSPNAMHRSFSTSPGEAKKTLIWVTGFAIFIKSLNTPFSEPCRDFLLKRDLRFLLDLVGNFILPGRLSRHARECHAPPTESINKFINKFAFATTATTSPPLPEPLRRKEQRKGLRMRRNSGQKAGRGGVSAERRQSNYCGQ
jgi:hypothetical protein